jgi:hypothetical protein
VKIGTKYIELPYMKVVSVVNRLLMLMCFLFQGSASGTLYIDDGQSFDYRKNKYLYLSLEFKGNKLSSRYSLLF